MPRRPSNRRSSPDLNLTELQRGQTRRIHNTRGSQSGQVIVSTLIDELLPIKGWRQPKTGSGAETPHPHGVLARLGNRCVKERRRSLFHKYPVVDAGLPENPGGLAGLVPRSGDMQESGIFLHCCTLFDVSDT